MTVPQFFFAELVRETSFDTGAGPLALGGAVAGHRGFGGVVPVGALFCYTIAGVTDPAEWETGTGRLGADGRIERVAVAASSSGGAAVAFAAGVKTVALTVGAGWYSAVSEPVGIGDVAGLQAALDGKQASGSYAAVGHGHGVGDVAGLQAALDGKQAVSTGFGAATTVNDGDAITLYRGTGWLNAPGSAFVRVNSVGRVGIGTTGPAHTLDVTGTAVRIASSASPAFLLQATGGTVRDGSLTLDPAGNIVLRNSSGGAQYFDSQTGAFHFRNFGSANAVVFSMTTASLAPGADNARSLGTASLRFSTVFAATGTISTSDAALKKHIGRVPETWLDAWGAVEWCRYRFRGGRRWHVGLVAQRVRDVFADHGLDACALGLLCRDDVPGGGERWGLRYEECLALEAIWVRRELGRVRGAGEKGDSPLFTAGDRSRLKDSRSKRGLSPFSSDRRLPLHHPAGGPPPRSGEDLP